MRVLMIVPVVLWLVTSAVAQQDCACARVEGPCGAYWTDGAVFVGRVESVKRETAARRVTFTVLDGFRGASSSTIEVLTGPSGQRCSLSFKTGSEYFVYASRTGPAGGLMTTACSRTRDIEDAAADLAYARAVKDGTAAAGRISGQVLLGNRDLAGRPIRLTTPLAGVTVRVTKDGVSGTAVTNQAGDFAFEGRGAGHYRVDVDVPEGYYSDNPSLTLNLGDPRACADAAATVYANGIVAGRVVNAAGRPIPGLTIEIATPQLGQRRQTITDRDGRYEIARLPAGRFVVGINTSPRIFHPGVDKIASASRVTLAAGQRLTLGELRVPAQIRFVSLSGFVLDVDGTPAEGARVYLRGVSEGAHIVAEPAVADFLGRFVIAAVAGVDYEIFAERSRSPRTDSTEPLRLNASEQVKPLRLVLRRRY